MNGAQPGSLKPALDDRATCLEARPDIVQRFPSIPFAQIYGMRNRVVHGYFAISLKLVWETIQTDIPELRKNLAEIIVGFPEG